MCSDSPNQGHGPATAVKPMLTLSATIARISPGRWRTFLAVAAAVSALVFAASAIRYFSVPKGYVNKLRIKLVSDVNSTGTDGSKPNKDYNDALLMQTECEVMRSDLVLAQLLNALGTNQTLVERQPGTQVVFADAGRIAQLRKQIEVRPLPKTNLLY